MIRNSPCILARKAARICTPPQSIHYKKTGADSSYYPELARLYRESNGFLTLSRLWLCRSACSRSFCSRISLSMMLSRCLISESLSTSVSSLYICLLGGSGVGDAGGSPCFRMGPWGWGTLKMGMVVELLEETFFKRSSRSLLSSNSLSLAKRISRSMALSLGLGDRGR